MRTELLQLPSYIKRTEDCAHIIRQQTNKLGDKGIIHVETISSYGEYLYMNGEDIEKVEVEMTKFMDENNYFLYIGMAGFYKKPVEHSALLLDIWDNIAKTVERNGATQTRKDNGFLSLGDKLRSRFVTDNNPLRAELVYYFSENSGGKPNPLEKVYK